jgi:chemotaxis protein methyltransferase CheR
LGFSSSKKYYVLLINDTSEEQLNQLIDRVTTNYTHYNRENDHFKFFYKTLLPEVTSRLQMKVWCTGWAMATGR